MKSYPKSNKSPNLVTRLAEKSKKITWFLKIYFSEDILKRDNAIWISPDGSKLVYASFNDSLVQEVRWKLYGNPEDAIVDPYPKEGTMRYPKVCVVNFEGMAHHWDLSHSLTIFHNKILLFRDYYVSIKMCMLARIPIPENKIYNKIKKHLVTQMR